MSCNEKARLASEVEGTWSGAPTVLDNVTTGDYSIIDTFTFQCDSTDEGGKIYISSMLNGTIAYTHPTYSLNQPISADVSGSAMISGSWKAIDDDEIAVIIDPASLTVNINPVEMILTSDILTQKTENNPEDMPAAVSLQAKTGFERALRPYYSRINHLDDVKVKDGTVLKFEIGDTDYAMMRQGGTSK